MKKSKDRLPGNRNYGYPQSGYPQDGYQNGYGYQQDGYPQNGYPQNGYQNGYGGYGYGGYGYGGYPGYGYPGYPGYGYPGYPGYGGYGYGGYPSMSNYIADNYPHEDYGNPNDPNDKSVSHDSEHGAQHSQEEPMAPTGTPPQSEEQEEPAAAEEPVPPEESAPQPEERRETPPPAEEKPETAFTPAASETSEAPASAHESMAGAGSGDVETLKAEAADLKRKWYAVTAEYDNYRKRTQNTRQEAYQEGRADVVKQLFPIGDNLDRAVKSCQDETTKKGINMVLAAFEKLLEAEKITVIDPVGQPFDPNECEAIMALDPQEGQESGIVTEVYVKGYAQGDKVLRYAQVIVTK